MQLDEIIQKVRQEKHVSEIAIRQSIITIQLNPELHQGTFYEQVLKEVDRRIGLGWIKPELDDF